MISNIPSGHSYDETCGKKHKIVCFFKMKLRPTFCRPFTLSDRIGFWWLLRRLKALSLSFPTTSILSKSVAIWWGKLNNRVRASNFILNFWKRLRNGGFSAENYVFPRKQWTENVNVNPNIFRNINSERETILKPDEKINNKINIALTQRKKVSKKYFCPSSKQKTLCLEGYLILIISLHIPPFNSLNF